MRHTSLYTIYAPFSPSVRPSDIWINIAQSLRRMQIRSLWSWKPVFQFLIQATSVPTQRHPNNIADRIRKLCCCVVRWIGLCVARAACEKVQLCCYIGQTARRTSIDVRILLRTFTPYSGAHIIWTIILAEKITFDGYFNCLI